MFQLAQKTQQAGNRWLSPLLLAIVAVVSVIITVDHADLAAAAECQVTDRSDGGTIQGMTTWKNTTSSILPLTITTERNTYGGFVPLPGLEIAQDIQSSRLAQGHTENRGIASIGACLSQDIRESALFNRAILTSHAKIPTKASTSSIKVPALLYNEKRPGLTVRTTLPEIGPAARNKKSGTFIGPVQEIQKPHLSVAGRVSQTGALLPSTVESPSSFGGQAVDAVHPFQSALQLPDNESLRMNLTTTQAVHGGNCTSGCP